DKAWNLVFQLLHGRLTLDDLAKQVADASAPALQARVDGLLRQLTFHKEQDNEARLRALLVDLAHDGGTRLPLDRYAALLSTELAGIVLTAHPTFSLSADAYAAALELMRKGAVSARPQASNGSAARGVAVRRHAPPTLQDELELSTVALRHLR